MPSRHFDVLVLGGGAAGFFAAINLMETNSSIQVAILEGSGKVLSKVQISGGGRCNVSHDASSISSLSQAYPRGRKFLKKAFQQYWVPDLVSWFKKKKVELKTEADGRMFPITDTSQTIINCFQEQVKLLKIPVLMNHKVLDIIKENEEYIIHTKSGDFSCNQLLVATGGHPKIEQFKYLQNLKLELINPCPSLFTFNTPQSEIRELMGLSVEKVKVVIPELKLKNEGPLLITHWGFSGPVILALSAFGAEHMYQKNYEFEFYIDWLPFLAYEEIQFYNESKQVNKLKPAEIPGRLWLYMLEKSNILPTKKGRDLSKAELNKLREVLKHDVYQVKGKTTFKEEFVTCGGVSLDEVNPNSMQSIQHPRLYFAGEVLNIDAITGGFNFQAAWTTAYIAAKHIALQYEV